MKNLISRHWDLLISLLIGAECLQALPNRLSVAFLKDFYYAGLSILALVFSVVFAAITLLSSIGDNDFLLFLEEEDAALSKLLASFGITLTALFVSLAISIGCYGIAAYRSAGSMKDMPCWQFACYCVALSYSLLSACLVGNDVIRFARLRARFLAERESA